jgi:curved DNA-binding protein CbpA
LKDYYAILHVLPTADVAVIAAAYRALARKYHPDIANGAAAREGNPMGEINEAYEVLSNADKRKAYDKKRSEMGSRAEFSSAEERMGPGQAEDWRLACSFCPEAKQCFEYLSLLSPSLAFAYAAYMLDSKRFAEAATVARDFDAQFMKSYFGSKEAAHSFARRLLLVGEIQAAKVLNRAVRVMGDFVDLDEVKKRILIDFPAAEPKLLYIRLAYPTSCEGICHTDTTAEVLRGLGGTCEPVNWFCTKFELNLKGTTEIVQDCLLRKRVVEILQTRHEFQDIWRGPRYWPEGQ